jgi:hypothetical protein
MKKTLILILLSFSVFSQDFSIYAPKRIDAIGSFQYHSATFFTYDRYSENYEDSVLTKELIGNSIEAFISQANKSIFEANKDSVVNKLLLNTFMSVSNYTSKWEAVKYRTVFGKDTSAYKFIILKLENQKLKIDTESITSKTLKNILSLKSEVFSQFEYEEPSKTYENLIAIIKKVKDIDGTLNLEKLSKEIEKKSLKKEYFDW